MRRFSAAPEFASILRPFRFLPICPRRLLPVSICQHTFSTKQLLISDRMATQTLAIKTILLNAQHEAPRVCTNLVASRAQVRVKSECDAFVAVSRWAEAAPHPRRLSFAWTSRSAALPGKSNCRPAPPNWSPPESGSPASRSADSFATTPARW